MRKGLQPHERARLLEAEIRDIEFAMQGNPISKRWQLLQIELSLKTSELTALNSKRLNNAPITVPEKPDSRHNV